MTVTWDGNTDGDGDNTSWHDQFNWNTNTVPGPGDDVVITLAGAGVIHSATSGTNSISTLFCTQSLTVSGGSLSILSMVSPSTIADLTVSNGTLSIETGNLSTTNLTVSAGDVIGPGDITIATLFTWSGGDLEGTGTMYANGAMDLESGIKDLLRDLEVVGTTTWTGGLLRVDDCVLTNFGHFDVQSDVNITYISTPGLFDNQATFQKSGGAAAGTTSVTARFDNDDTVDVQAGRVSFDGGGTHTGDFTGLGIVDFGGGTHTIGTTSSVTAADVVFGGGTVDIHGTFNVSGSTTVSGGGPHTFHADATVLSVGDPLTISSGTVDFSSGETIAVAFYTQSSGVLTGSDDVTVSDLLAWTGGNLEGTGTMFANGDMDLGGGIKDCLRDLEVTGTTIWTGGLLRIVGGTFTNFGLFDAQTDSSVSFYGTAGTFDNQGTFRKFGGGGITTVSVTFNSPGTVEVQTGTVTFTGVGTYTGDLLGMGTVGFGGGTHTLAGTSAITTADVVFSTGTTDIHGTYDVSGSTTVAGGTHTFHAEALVLDVGATLTVNSGTVDFGSGETIAVTFYSQSAGTLEGSDDVTVSSLLTWTGGDIDGTGTMFANGDMDLAGGIKDLLRDLEVTGTTTWTNGLFRIVDNLMTNLGLFDVQTDADITFFGTAGAIDNQGTFRKSGGTDLTSVTVAFDSTGPVVVQTGTVSFNGGGTFTNDFTGLGSVGFGGGTTTVTAASTIAVTDLTFGGGVTDMAASPITVLNAIFSGGTSDLHDTVLLIDTSITVSGGGPHTFQSTVNLLDNGDTLTVSNGTVDFSSGEPIAVTTYNQSGGVLRGSDTVTISGLLTWTGGDMDGTGTTIANGDMAFSGGIKDLLRNLEVAGDTTWTNGLFRIVDGVLTN
ncbi:MAG: beta strand repeat-containing protein, partial [Planctomycetota bacterium]